MKYILHLSVLLMLFACGHAFADDPSTGTSADTISPAQQKAEIDGAKAAVQKMESATTFAEFGQCLTNRSAGPLAMITGALTVSFSSGMSSANTYLSNPTNPPVKPTESASEQQFKAIMAKYGLTENTADPMPIFKLHGREFFADVAALLATLPGHKDSYTKSGPQATDMVYKVVSATEVDATSASDPKSNVSLYLEDDAWRLDMGNMFQSPTGSASSPNNTIQPTPQVQVTQTQQPPIFDAVTGGNLQRISELYAADHSVVNQKNATGAGPLASAAFFDNTDVINLLISEGAEVNAQDNLGDTALIQAVQFNHIDGVQVLLAHGARTGFKDTFGKTALSIAKSNNESEIVHLLEAAGATR